MAFGGGGRAARQRGQQAPEHGRTRRARCGCSLSTACRPMIGCTSPTRNVAGQRSATPSPVGTIFPRQFDEFESYVNAHSELQEIDYDRLISLIHCTVCSEPGPVQPEWAEPMRDFDLSTDKLELQKGLVNLEIQFDSCCREYKVWVCCPVSAASTLFGIFCGLGLHSLQYNPGSLALAEHTACRIGDLTAKIGDSIMICGDQAVVQHLARRLYVTISWYQRFGNDSQLEARSWRQFENLRQRIAVVCFHLEACSLESRWPSLFPFASWPYTDEDDEPFLPPLTVVVR